MKSIFFLLPVLLFSIFGLQESFGEKGLNYDDTIITSYPNGTQVHKWVTVPERILSDGEYVDFRFIDGVDFLSVETGHGSVILNKDTCSFDFYKKGLIDGTPLFTDSIVAKMATNGTENWSEVTQITNAACEASGNENELVAKKFVAGIGLLEYKYINTGSAWKTQLEATNLSGQTNKKFGFTQTINLNRDVIDYGGSQKNLDDYNGTTFNRTWLETNQGKVIDFLNDISFDFDLSFDNLKSVAVYDTGLDKSKLAFNYLYDSQILLPDEIIVIDPTYGYTASTTSGGSANAIVGTASCVDGTIDGGALVNMLQYSGECQNNFFKFDVSSITGTVATVSSANIKYSNTEAGSGTAFDCVVREISTQTPVSNDLTTYEQGFTGSTLSDTFTSCKNANTDTVQAFNSAGRSVLKTSLNAANTWFTVSMHHVNYGAAGDFDAGGNYMNGMTMSLEITYTVLSPPWAVTDLTSTAETTTTVSLDWTAPYAGGGGQTITGYQINKTSPYSVPNTILVNDTGTTTTDYIATGLTAGTQYSFRVSAWTNNTGGHPYNNATGNIYNVTTPLNSYSTVKPLNLNVIPVYCNPAQLNLEWSSGAMQNINGYRIQRETPVGGGFTTIVSNTTNTLLYYNNTGLTANNNYNYRVYSLNLTGISAASTADSHYTCHKPNAVTTLTGTATDLSTIVLTWTAPIPYGVLLGYMVNFTTPDGNPTTIFDANTGTSLTTDTVYGLTIGANYSFRVSPVTIFGSNSSGNIFNATTTTAFELGNLALEDTTNTDDFKIFYERTDTNATSILLEVTYPASYDLSCNMLFKFSRDNNTYTGLTETPIPGPGDDTDNVVSSFTFNGANTEIITINCYDESVPDSAKYIITITQFELLDQIANFRNGTYGTMGQIGGLDLITLIVVIIGMIGFNRVTPIAGVIFTVITVGALSVMGIIELYQIIFPALALIVLLAYTRTRQSD